MAKNETNPNITARAAQAAHEAIDQISDRSAEAEERLRQAGAQASKRTEELAGDVSEYVSKNPLTAVGIAAAAGFIIGALLRR